MSDRAANQSIDSALFPPLRESRQLEYDWLYQRLTITLRRLGPISAHPSSGTTLDQPGVFLTTRNLGLACSAVILRMHHQITIVKLTAVMTNKSKPCQTVGAAFASHCCPETVVCASLFTRATLRLQCLHILTAWTLCYARSSPFSYPLGLLYSSTPRSILSRPHCRRFCTTSFRMASPLSGL